MSIKCLMLVKSIWNVYQWSFLYGFLRSAKDSLHFEWIKSRNPRKIKNFILHLPFNEMNRRYKTKTLFDFSIFFRFFHRIDFTRVKYNVLTATRRVWIRHGTQTSVAYLLRSLESILMFLKNKRKKQRKTYHILWWYILHIQLNF